MVQSPTTVAELLEPLTDVTGAGLHFEDEFVCWRDHLRLSACRASALRRLVDLDRPRHMALLLDNIPEFSYLLGAAVLGDLVVVGLNPTRRGAALAGDIATADCQIVLVEDATADLLAGVDLPGVTVLNVDRPEWAELLAPHSGQRPEFAATDPDALLMLIFTSGTSGDPKAVQCSHRKFAASGAMLSTRFGLGPSDVVYLSMPLFHSNAIIAGWMVAVAGGSSVALRRKFSASAFFDDIRRFGATYANYVGKPLSYVLATPDRPDDADNPLRILYGNEASAADIVAVSKRFDVRVVDGFGSTEGGVAIARTPDTPPDALGPLTPPNEIRDPVTGRACATALFDDHGRLINADEAVGEIVNSSGGGLFTGYYRNPEADAERMRDGIYHSGDLGYVDADGYVYFAGRLGDWVRVDGENMGTGPIERVLLRHPGIAMAAVYGVRADIGDELAAALVAPDLTAAELTEFLSAQTDLGPKQWPSRVRVVSDLPRTDTFKILKRTLAADDAPPTWVRTDRSLEYITP
ncbi:long-chain-fatty-acid--CoA ligase [Williamsia sp. 1135]|uniref:long-chain-fatty-acid--CoA ligase n=1 Tax=Williamsia sp. 1135 TaxID=1889262 RepID=UPI000A122BAB|nr:long-chain-fatty-acid--CoA ligase [Williamsia sp. 1135]ORM35146.1 acyl-CoA synthetase [Williamsia sp. 1135]